MSSVQKKRKNTTGSGSKGQQREVGDGFAEPRRDSSENDDTEDEKILKRKAPSNSGGCVNRLCVVFVTLVCLAFYDVAQVNTRIYSAVFHVSSQHLVKEASRRSQRAHRSSVLEVIAEETRKTDLILIRSGAVSKPRLGYESERVLRVLSGGDAEGEPVDKAESNKERDAAPLFQDINEVLELDKEAEERIRGRTGKVLFTVRKEGYNLGATSLRSGERVHDTKRLEDYGQLSAERAKLIAEKEGDDTDDSARTGAGAGGDGHSLDVEESSVEDPAKREGEPAAKEALNRKMAFAKREPDPEFVKFVEELRSDNTFAHLGRKNDMERALKTLGYKQSTKSSRKAPMWIGFEDKGKCPAFKKDEVRISFCPYYLPQNKADQFSHLLAFEEKVPQVKLKPDFYPITWRLYKEQERRSLKLHCTNESMSEFGEAYVRKFTVPGSNYMKSAESIYDQLVKSDKKVKELTKETKNRAIVQLYINNPLLIEERKFIIRTFAVIVSAKPFIAFYHDGAVFRSIVKYKPFARHDSDYKKAAHITSEQKSAQKKVLKSSELYTSFNSLQTYLTRAGHDEKYVNAVLRPQMKARMIYALYSIFKRQRSGDDDPNAESEQPLDRTSDQLPPSAAVIQTSCFDFLLDEKKKLWLITVATGQHCFINMGGASFRPAWKAKLQEALSENTAKLSEEVLWRRMNKKPISSMRFYTQTDMTVLIDETFPDWDLAAEINAHVDGIQVAQDNHDYSSAAENDEMELDSIIGITDDKKGGRAGQGSPAAEEEGEEEDEGEEEEGDAEEEDP